MGWLPDPRAGLDVAASYQPAAGGTTVVGDFYDLFHVRGPWWSTVVGDVCGKGVEAAKVTALARYTLRADAVQHLWPAAVLRRLNCALLDQQQSDRFLTATYGLDAAATINHLSQILALHTGGWASDDTALLALRVPPRS